MLTKMLTYTEKGLPNLLTCSPGAQDDDKGRRGLQDDLEECGTH